MYYIYLSLLIACIPLILTHVGDLTHDSISLSLADLHLADRTLARCLIFDWNSPLCTELAALLILVGSGAGHYRTTLRMMNGNKAIVPVSPLSNKREVSQHFLPPWRLI